MKYHNITKHDMLNGEGLRVVLWVSGCEHRCDGCHNKITWDINCGLEFDEAAEQEIFDELSKEYVSGITFSGGDPLHTLNREEIGKLIYKIKERYSDKSIWIYTGYLWEDVCELDFIKEADVLVDGRFVKDMQDRNLFWRGSSNQRVINIKETLTSGKIVHYITEGETV